jgi:hypothetical protein
MVGHVNGRDKKCTKELVKYNLSVLIFGRFNVIQIEVNIPMHVKKHWREYGLYTYPKVMEFNYTGIKIYVSRNESSFFIT